MRTAWSKLPDGEWGIRVEPEAGHVESGDVVTVRNRNGASRAVTLGDFVDEGTSPGEEPGERVKWQRFEVWQNPAAGASW